MSPLKSQITCQAWEGLWPPSSDLLSESWRGSFFHPVLHPYLGFGPEVEVVEGRSSWLLCGGSWPSGGLGMVHLV